MKRIVALVGVRGAGKSTLLRALAESPHVKTLQPITDRPPRGGEEEYEFVDQFPRSNAMAWMIKVGGYSYGMRNRQVKSIPIGCCGVTVFDPGNIHVLQEFRQHWTEGEVVTVGLDTIETVNEQSERVEGNENRKMTKGDFDSHRAEVCKSDIVLRGDVDTIREATMAVCEILVSRGGLVGESWLTPLIGAGALLDKAQLSEIQPASYDLRLGSEVWCQGKRYVLTEQNPFFKIPPYSYAIVKAQEIAKIPRFMAGRFDLTVSLFFKGVLLSNGPQVDPGYEGALFCTLFNGRDVHANLKKGDHFATIEFCTLGNRVDGYLGQYQGKKDLNDFLLAETGTGPGGDIVGRINKLESRLEAVTTGTAKSWWIMAGIFATVVSIAVTVELFLLSSLKSHFEKTLDQMVLDAKGDIEAKLDGLSQIRIDAEARVAEEIQKVDEVGSRTDEFNQRLESLESKLKFTDDHSSGSAGNVPSNSDDESNIPPAPPNGL